MYVLNRDRVSSRLYLYTLSFFNKKVFFQISETEITMIENPILYLNNYLIILSINSYVILNSDLTVKTRLPNYIEPISYDIHLIQTEENNFNGSCDITIKINRPTQIISFHVQITQANLRSVFLQNIKSSYTYIPEKYMYYIKSQILDVYFHDTLDPGNYILNTEFITPRDDKRESLFKIFYINEKEERM